MSTTVAAAPTRLQRLITVGSSPRWVGVGTWSTLALVGILGMREAERLISQITSASGATAPASQVYRPSARPDPVVDAVHVWTHRPPGGVSFDVLWRTLTGFDLLFIAGYLLLLLLLLPSTWRRLRWCAVALALADLLEDAFQVWAIPHAVALGGLETGWAWISWGLTVVKWLLVLVLGVGLVIQARRVRPAPTTTTGPAMPSAGRRLLTAVKWQRYTVVMVVVLLVLMTGSGSDMLDQVPDAQRAWLPVGWRSVDALTAFVALALVSCALVSLGRLRAHQLERRSTPKERTPGALYVVPIAIALGLLAVGAAVAASGASVAWVRTSMAALVIGGPPLVSYVGWRRNHVDVPEHRTSPVDPASVATARDLGDALAVTLLAIGFLGLVRSYTAPAMLYRPWLVFVPVIFGLLAVALWWTAGRALENWPAWLDEPYSSESDIPTRLPAFAVVVTLLAIAVSLALLLEPIGVSSALGLVGTAVTALGALVLGFGWLTATLNASQPVELLRVFGLRATPFLSMLLLVGLLGNAFSPRDEQHDIRTTATAGSTTPAADSLDAALASWLAQAPTCVVGGRPVRPLVLVAASGGGIRAAQWTVQSLARIHDLPCGKGAVFLSSGVSGGSIGLAIDASLGAVGGSPGGVGGDGQRAVDAISGPEALSAGVAGLLVTDLVAGMTGIPLPSADRDPGQPADRAALMEKVWEQQVASLAHPARGGLFDSVGFVVLNSTSAAGLCRVQVSTTRLTPALEHQTLDPSTAPPQLLDGAPPSCSTTPVANSYQLEVGRCLPGVSWATAGMLSARFPYVTPSGIVSLKPSASCRLTNLHDAASGWDQLIDGGYAESTGLGTIVDLAPLLRPLIERTNQHLLATGAAPIVPFVVLLENGYGSDVTPAPSGGVSEPQVPITGRGAQGASSGTRALLQRAEAEYGQAAPAGYECIAGVSVVAPRSQPRVEAPLGWVLSQMTIDDMASANAGAFEDAGGQGAYPVAGLRTLLGSPPTSWSCG